VVEDVELTAVQDAITGRGDAADPSSRSTL
jgi:hypothetical protein